MDTKVIAGAGVATTVVVGGVSYAATKGSSEDSKNTETTTIANQGSPEDSKDTVPTQTTGRIRETLKKISYAEKIKNAGFELLTEQSQEIDGITVMSFNDASETNNLKNECKILIKKTYSGTEIPEDYKETIKKCTKKEELKERLGRIGLAILTENDYAVLESRGNSIKEDTDFNSELKETYIYDFEDSDKGTYSEKNAKELIGSCELYSKNNHSYIRDIDTKGKRFLTLCSKGESGKTYNTYKDLSYGTNE